MTDEMIGQSSLSGLEWTAKILLVDDVELFLELEKTFFRREGVDLLVARNGEEALKLIAKEHPDLVFLDLYMPDINGDDVCRRVKRDKQQKEIPIIMVIQSGSAKDEQLCQDAGCNEILYKPVRREDFIAAAGRNLLIAERVHPRIEASLIINFGLQPTKFVENFSVNISEGGVFIATGAILTVGTQLDLEFELPGSGVKISCAGRVAWVNHPDWIKMPTLPVGMGIEFTDVKSEHLELLQLFVDHQKPLSSVL